MKVQWGEGQVATKVDCLLWEEEGEEEGEEEEDLGERPDNRRKGL